MATGAVLIVFALVAVQPCESVSLFSNMSIAPTDSPSIDPPPIVTPRLGPNPWADSAAIKPPSPKPLAIVPTPELGGTPHPFDDAILPTTPSKVGVDLNLLSQFDPLADKVEHDAHDAWAGSEGNPPPPAPPPKPTAQPLLRTLETRLASAARQPRRPSTLMEPPTSAAAHVTTFATLASLARVPFGRRSRTTSTTQPPQPAEDPASQSELPSTPLRNSIPVPPSSAAPATPARANRLQGDPSKADPPFDFQKFLDQMKTKAAEPVAKYLRRYSVLKGLVGSLTDGYF